MEAKESGGGGGGVTVVGSDAPTNYHMAPRTDSIAGSTRPPVTAIQPAVLSPETGTLMKKKRGRPRKYAPDGSVIASGLSPKPISSSAPGPPVIDFSIKQPQVKPVTGSVIKQHKPKFEVQNLGNCSGKESWGEHHREHRQSGEWVSCSVGANFTPHIITVSAGEDVTMKIISFSQQGPRAICILSANGVISSVTLRQPDSSGGTLTYEGRFEILSLTGSFMPSESGGIRNRSGGMSVSLASPDGRVVGGGVAGLLVAASPVQIVVGSFLAGNQHEPKTKKQKPTEHIVTSAVPISSVVSMHNFHGIQGLPNHSSG